eukprot:15364-Rhodomonas_salina.1
MAVCAQQDWYHHTLRLYSHSYHGMGGNFASGSRVEGLGSRGELTNLVAAERASLEAFHAPEAPVGSRDKVT